MRVSEIKPGMRVSVQSGPSGRRRWVAGIVKCLVRIVVNGKYKQRVKVRPMHGTVLTLTPSQVHPADVCDQNFRKVAIDTERRERLERQRQQIESLLRRASVTPRAICLSSDGHALDLQIHSSEIGTFHHLLERGRDGNQSNKEKESNDAQVASQQPQHWHEAQA